MGVAVPLVGDFHYIGHKLLTDHPACAEALDKYRINPGNVGFKDKKDRQFGAIVETGDPARQGGAHRRQLGLARPGTPDPLMDENASAARAARRARGDARGHGAVGAVVGPARRGNRPAARQDRPLRESLGGAGSHLRLSHAGARARDYALHLGLTEAGMGSKGIVASSAAMGMLLQEGIGDTIRVSLTPEPGGDRTLEVQVAQEILQTMGFRTFVPLVAACPGCGRTTSTVFQELARDIQAYIRDGMPDWQTRYPGVETLNVAVMGCIVNGPGESKHADIGISLPGTGETPSAPVFIDGEKAMTLRGEGIADEFVRIVDEYLSPSVTRRCEATFLPSPRFRGEG